MPGPTFRPENALEEGLLRAYQTGDLDPLLATLGPADVYLPAEDGPDQEEPVTAGEGEEIPLPVLEAADDGGRFVPVFSSLTQLAHARPSGGGYRRLTGQALASIMPADVGLALNPGGELGRTLQPDEVRRLTSIAPSSGGEPEFLVGEPRAEPTQLLDTIVRVAESRTDVRAAYRALLVRRPGAEPEHVIGLQLSAHVDPREAIDAAAGAARAAGVERLGLIPLQPGADSGQIGGFMLNRTKPFWLRVDGD